MGRLRPSIGLSTSIIPLQESHLKTLMSHLYTARFEVKNGKAYRYGMDPKAVATSIFLPNLPDVPDGCYEFYNGKAYQIKWQGVLRLPHPTPSIDIAPTLCNCSSIWE